MRMSSKAQGPLYRTEFGQKLVACSNLTDQSRRVSSRCEKAAVSLLARTVNQLLPNRKIKLTIVFSTKLSI